MSLDLDDFNKTVHRLGEQPVAPVEVSFVPPDTARTATSNMQLALINTSVSRQARCGTPRRKEVEVRSE